MRSLTLLTALLLACTGPAAGSHATPTPTQAVALSCEPTRSRDGAGVITLDGRLGIVGETFAHGSVMNGGFWLVRKGAVAGDRVALHFEQIGATAPAKWVEYSVSASPRTTPWGDVAFSVGWKPIAFFNSCWRLVVDGSDTGLVLAVGQ